MAGSKDVDGGWAWVVLGVAVVNLAIDGALVVSVGEKFTDTQTHRHSVTQTYRRTDIQIHSHTVTITDGPGTIWGLLILTRPSWER